MPTGWSLLSSLTAAYTLDVETADANHGYNKSVYMKHNIPTRPSRLIGIRLVSQSKTDAGIVYETLVTKAELESLVLSYLPKAKF